MAQYFQVVDSVIDNQSEDQPQATYSNIIENPGVHYIIQSTDPTQTFVLDNVMDQSIIQQIPQQQVFLVSSSQKDNTMQPVVLNHQLQQKVLIPQSAPQGIVVPQQQIQVEVRNRMQVPKNVIGPVQQRMAKATVMQNSGVRNRLVNSLQGVVNRPRQPVVTQGVEKQESIVQLEDGRVMPMSDYQKLMEAKRNRQQFPNESRLLNQNSIRPTRPQMQRTPRPPGPPRPTARPAVHSPNLRPNLVNRTTRPVVNATNITPKSSSSKIISPNPSRPWPRVLREFVPPPEIKDIVNKNINDEEFENSIRMFVLLACGEQRLITFTTPKEECTIQEILEQVGVSVEPQTYIAIREINQEGINIVVSVGYDEDEIENEEISVTQNGRTSTKNASITTTTTPELSPEPQEEPPKLISGMMALCTHCGYLSEDFNKCQRCRRKLPDNIKAVPMQFGTVQNRNSLKKPAIEINLKARTANALNNSATQTNNTSSSSVPAVIKTTPVRKKIIKPRLQETESIVTLSSDSEDDDSETKPDYYAKEPSVESLRLVTASVPKNKVTLTYANLSCRNIRIGSYRITVNHDVSINEKEMTLQVPHVKTEETVTIIIQRKNVHKVLVCFQKALLVIFIYVYHNASENISAALGMTSDSEPFFDSVSTNELHKRITLLPSVIKEEDKSALMSIYSDPTIIEELSANEANAILMKSCNKVTTLPAITVASNIPQSGVQQLLIYPPGKGGISINTEDYMCLERDQFLNDVIIDFYLKYTVDQLPLIQRQKVQVFSTFFYTRLTTKPAKSNRKIESEALLTAAQKRHARVKNWTKNIDLFTKDFIIVPINENAHWFLAIICFPGLKGAETFDGVSVKREHCKPIKKPKVNNSKTTIPPIQIKPPKAINPLEDLSLDPDKDEAEGDDSEFEADELEDAPVTNLNEVPIKQPCILIFDSLAGAGRSRVVATLRDYLTCEYIARKHEDYTFTKDTISGACPKIPQQNNFTDCGLYILQYVESFFNKPIKDYRIPIKGITDWFDETVVKRKREDISNLIVSLMVKYKKDTAIIPPISLPTQNGDAVDHPDDGNEDEEMTEDKSDSDVGSSQDSLFGAASNCSSNSPDSQSSGNLGTASRQKAMSYLKAKRIIKTRAENEDAKKMRLNN